MQTLSQQLEKNKEVFLLHYGKTPSLISYAPGRINIIGEHTDYNFGLTMPCAINRWICVSFYPREDKQISVYSKDFEETIKFDISQAFQPSSIWQHYVYGCLRVFENISPIKKGFDAVIMGNVPIGSGVSSSAALEVAFMNGLKAMYKKKIHDVDLIQLCQKVEHEYLHVKTGLLDQYASQFSKSKKAMLLDLQTLTHEYIPLELPNYKWVLCDTKIKRELAGSKYSERVHETGKALNTLKQKNASIKTFRDIEEKHLPYIENPTEQKRMLHYIQENKRVKKAVEALLKKDAVTFGNIITASHISLRDLYEVSCEELDFLVEKAIATNYCLGSRMMGGGFGGCTINLVEEEKIESFSKKMKAAYLQEYKRETEINVYSSVDGADVHYNQ